MFTRFMFEATEATASIQAYATGLPSGTAPDISPRRPPGMEKFDTIAGWVLVLAILALVVFVIIAGVRIAAAYREGEQIPGGVKALGWACVGCIVVGSASGFVSALI